MTSADITIAVTGGLLAAFTLGWLAHWLWARMLNASAPRADSADELAAELLKVEEERDSAIMEARRGETEAKATLRERTAELNAAMDSIASMREELETLRRG